MRIRNSHLSYEKPARMRMDIMEMGIGLHGIMGIIENNKIAIFLHSSSLPSSYHHPLNAFYYSCRGVLKKIRTSLYTHSVNSLLFLK